MGTTAPDIGAGGAVGFPPMQVDVVDDAPTEAAVAAPTGQRRRIERLNPAAPPAGAGRGARPGRGPASAAAMFEPLDPEDTAIPFDRVPYVPADLRRVAIIASAMVVLIIIAAIIVSNVVK